MLFRDIVTSFVSGQSDRSGVSFYIKRIAQEKAVRTLSVVAVVAVVLLQTVTWLAPPKVSQASSGSANDIIYGGFTSKADLLNKYNSNNELRSVYLRFGIGYDQINGSTPSSVNSSSNVWSAGRYSHGAASENIRLDTPGAATPIYIRPLRVWGAGINFPALTGIAADGRRFWILFDCGNPVIEALKTDNPAAKTTPPPATPPPVTPPPTPAPTPVPTSTPNPTPTPATPTPVPQASYRCDLLKAYMDEKNTDLNPPLNVTFDVDSTVVNTTRSAYEFDFGDGNKSTVTKLPVNHVYTKVGEWTASVRVKTTAGTTPFVQACSQKIKVVSQDLVYLKTAENLTVKDKAGKPTNAAGTTVQSGNEIRYTLSVKNNGTSDLSDFQFKEDIGDILEYADVTDPAGAQRIDTPLVNQATSIAKTLVWSRQTIGAGKTATKSFVVKIKNPLPTTPRGITNPSSFDLQLENIFYDNSVLIKVAPPVVKQVEVVAKSLPATGSGLTNLWLGMFAAGAIFIALRQRLIAKELELMVTTGGQG